MATPQINISSLEFESIKNSIKTYISSKPEFSGYDFNGAGFNLLLDIFAYNTLYYSFYSNMIANETYVDTAKIENNIVSLVKPLGFLVAGKSCSKIELAILPSTSGSSVTLNAYTDYFIGASSSGASYRFYPIENKTVVSGSPSTITLYEAKRVVNNIPISVDIANQKAFLGNTDIDLNTLTVKVNGVTWTKFNTYQASSGPDGNVYFVDRTSRGFYIIFGKRTLNDYQTSFGKNVIATDIVSVSYLVPTGKIANGISSVTNSLVTVTTPSVSGNGTDSVDLDLVKFFAPKLFATNDRAVTKDDYYGLLLSTNLLPAGIDSQTKVNIWGGEDSNPVSHGRVFVSFADSTLNTQTESVKKCISYLKNKSVVTVIPEYVQSQTVTVNLNLTASIITTPELSAVKTVINNNYNTYTFNNNVKLSDIRSLIAGYYPNVRGLDTVSATMTQNVIGSGGVKVLYFKNELKKQSGTVRSISSSPFTYRSTTITIADKPVANSTKANLIALNPSGFEITALGTIGYVDYTNGIVYINSEVIPDEASVNITAILKYPDNIIIKDEFLITLNSTITRA